MNINVWHAVEDELPSYDNSLGRDGLPNTSNMLYYRSPSVLICTRDGVRVGYLQCRYDSPTTPYRWFLEGREGHLAMGVTHWMRCPDLPEAGHTLGTPDEQHQDHFLHLGRRIIIRLVLKGDRYGREGCLTHDQDDPLVEFYDGDYDHNPWLGIKGQFLSRYNLSTLLEHEPGGLDLYGGQPKWQIDYQEFWYVRQWLQARYP